MQKNIWICNREGEKISGTIFYPSIKRKIPALIFSHGFASSKYTKIKLASRISKKGFVVLLFDASGCGESAGKFEEHTVEKYVNDMKSAFDYISDLDFVDKSKVAVAGHSLGGMVSVIFASEKKDAALAIPIDAPLHITKNKGPSSPFADKFFLLAWEKSGFAHFNVRSKRGKVIKKLSHDFIKKSKKFDLLKSVKKVRCPIVIIQGASDTCVIPNSAKLLFKAANKPKKLFMVPGVNHRYKGKNELILENLIVKSLNKYLINS
jgi:uncharacterized protein